MIESLDGGIKIGNVLLVFGPNFQNQKWKYIFHISTCNSDLSKCGTRWKHSLYLTRASKENSFVEVEYEPRGRNI